MYRGVQEPDNRDGKTSGQVGSGRVDWIGSDRIGPDRVGSGRVGSGRVAFLRISGFLANFQVSREYPGFPTVYEFLGSFRKVRTNIHENPETFGNPFWLLKDFRRTDLVFSGSHTPLVYKCSKAGL